MEKESVIVFSAIKTKGERSLRFGGGQIFQIPDLNLLFFEVFPGQLFPTAAYEDRAHPSPQRAELTEFFFRILFFIFFFFFFL